MAALRTFSHGCVNFAWVRKWGACRKCHDDELRDVPSRSLSVRSTSGAALAGEACGAAASKSCIAALSIAPTFLGGRVSSFVALASSSGVSLPCLAYQSSRKEPSAVDRRFAAVASVSASAGAMLTSMGAGLFASVSLRFFTRLYEAVSSSAVLFINRLPQRELCFRPRPYVTTMEPRGVHLQGIAASHESKTGKRVFSSTQSGDPHACNDGAMACLRQAVGTG